MAILDILPKRCGTKLRAVAWFLLCLVSVTSCGLALREDGDQKNGGNQDLGQGLLSGQFQSISGTTVDLEADSNFSQILMFVSETCIICRRETEGLVAHLSAIGRPVNIKFYSLMIGAIPEDAEDWADELGVSWSIGIDGGDRLFRAYCPELKTPCVLLRNSETKQISKLIGEHSLQKWQSLTGEWRYQ